MNSDLDTAKSQADEEHSARAELQRQLAKLTSEFTQYKSKHDSNGGARSEELEEIKRKLTAKITEAEEM